MTATNKQRTLAGYVGLLLFSASIGCFGALGGFLFWATIRPRKPRPPQA